MALSDKSLGAGMLTFAGATFVYYTVWAVLLPFFDASSPIHSWFPSREWAVRVPAFILVLGISAIGLFLGCKAIGGDETTPLDTPPCPTENNREPSIEMMYSGAQSGNTTAE